MECSIEGCAKTVQCRGWCPQHYQRWRQYGDPLAPSRVPRAKPCAVEECDKLAYSHGFCNSHLGRWKRYGDPLAGGPPREPRGICSVDGCDKSAPQCHDYGDRLCSTHLMRWRTHGDVQADKPLAGQWTNTICSVDGCGRDAKTRGMCKLHYQRWTRTGDTGPAEPLRILGNDEERFWSYVEKRDDGCWLWTGSSTRRSPDYPDRYGIIGIGGVAGVKMRAHRYAYELLIGPVPDGMHLHHRCGNPPCVNPAHLEPVSPAEHMRLHDPWEAARKAANARTTCRRGHPHDIYARHNGRQWVCRECIRINAVNRDTRRS